MGDMGAKEISGRRNIRVSVFFPILWRRADDNAEDLAAEIENHKTSDRFTTPPTAFADLPSDLSDLAEFKEMSPHTFTVWMTIERKLDYIIRALNPKIFSDPEMERSVCLNLSAGGANIRIKPKMKKGDMLLVRFTLPTFPLFIVEALAKVKSQAEDKEKKNEWLTRIRFESINLGDKEDLIAYVFKRQREILRLKSE